MAQPKDRCTHGTTVKPNERHLHRVHFLPGPIINRSPVRLLSRSFEDRLLLTLSIRVVHSGVTFSKKFLYVFILIPLVIFRQTRCYYSDSGDVPRKQLEYYPPDFKTKPLRTVFSVVVWWLILRGGYSRVKDLEIKQLNEESRRKICDNLIRFNSKKLTNRTCLIIK